MHMQCTPPPPHRSLQLLETRVGASLGVVDGADQNVDETHIICVGGISVSVGYEINKFNKSMDVWTHGYRQIHGWMHGGRIF
jgi:hypothetical protein